MLRTIKFFLLLLLVIIPLKAGAVTCDSLASLTVTPDKTTYTEGETVDGDIVFTNSTGAPVYVDATGNIYDKDMNLIMTKLVSGTIPEGANTYSLSDVFGTLYIDASVPKGVYKIELSVTAPSEACTWVDSAFVNIIGIGNTYSVPGDFATIQEAIDASKDGDIINVSDGTYVENINYYGKAITLQSVNGPASTIIDGGTGSVSSVVIFANGETNTSVLSGFTITNGTGSWGGGIYLESVVSPTIINCIITGNHGDIGGGINAAISADSSPYIADCIISGNTAADVVGGIYLMGGTPTITNCTIEGNSGGGLSIYDSAATISDCTISYNDNSGIFIGSSPAATIENCTIANNFGLGGGGISLQLSSATITGCTITGGWAMDGGGIFCDNSSPTITNCTIANNGSDFSGGGISIWHSSSPTIINCTIANNFSYNIGGGISTFFGPASATIVNTIFWGNSIPIAGYGEDIWLDDPGSSVDINFTDIDPSKINGSGTVNMGPGNINDDPLFVDGTNPSPELRDYHLLIGSPCIDVGDDGSVSGALVPFDDIDGDPRPMGIGFDIGSDEAY